MSTSVIIPSRVTTIGNSAFKNCTAITSIILPESVSTIGSDDENTGAFQGCTQLQYVKLPTTNANFTKIYSSTFLGCTSLTSIRTISNIPTTSIIIPTSVTTIGTSAFKNCAAITSIIIPESVSTIGSDIENTGAFQGCTQLQYVKLPTTNANFTKIYSSTFLGCTSLTSIRTISNIPTTSIIIPTSVTTIGTSAFKNCAAITSIIIPESVSTIGSDIENTGAFQGCTQLQYVKLPTTNANFTKIYSSTFLGCTSLTSIRTISNIPTTSIIIPTSVTTIGTSAFKNCAAITSIILPSFASFTTIDAYAFMNCASLRTIRIPNTVTTIGTNAFLGCTSLISVYLSDTTAETLGNLSNELWGIYMELPPNRFFGAPSSVYLYPPEDIYGTAT